MTAQLDMLDAARLAATERQERSEARVQRTPDEVLLCTLLASFLAERIATRGSMSSNDAKEYLDQAGVVGTGKEGLSVRRRIVSTTVCQGKRAGVWKWDGYVQGIAGRPVSRWIMGDV